MMLETMSLTDIVSVDNRDGDKIPAQSEEIPEGAIDFLNELY